MNPRRLRDMLGPAGAAALASAVDIIAEAYPDDGELAVTWANWTDEEWNFTFRRRSVDGRLVIHLPHDGGHVSPRRQAKTSSSPTSPSRTAAATFS